MPRYVVLRHECPPGSPRSSHWDFMLEVENGLRTWAIQMIPAAVGRQPADELPHHRLAYLDYEGPISGDRGSVTRWDSGTYRVVRESGDRLEVTLQGEQLVGLAKLAGLPGEPNWTFEFIPDNSCQEPANEAS